MAFREITPEELDFNPFQKIGKQWMLIAAGDEKGFNMMTASWGGAGVMWGKPAATVYIRPQRYTKEFVDREETFTMSFFKEEYRNSLKICGSTSGRDCDKIKEAGLTPYFTDAAVGFEEAEIILVCRKMYTDMIKSEFFIDKESEEKWYPQKDYHMMYIAEIEKVLVKE